MTGGWLVAHVLDTSSGVQIFEGGLLVFWRGLRNLPNSGGLVVAPGRQQLSVR